MRALTAFLFLLITAAFLLASTLSSCSQAPRVDPFLVRAELSGAYAFQPLGIARAREDEEEGELEGDNVRLQRDLNLGGALGWGAAVDIRPLLNDELRLSFRDVSRFEGDTTLDRSRRFDGRTYAAGERIESELEWRSWSISAAHRVLSLGNASGSSGPLADVQVRAGVESSTFDMELEGSTTPEESRQVRTGAPFVAIEGRAAVMPRTIFEHSLAAGYWNHDGSRLDLIEGTAGFRVNVVGPLEVLLRYEFLLRDGKARFDDGEISRVAFQTHAVSTGLAVRF